METNGQHSQTFVMNHDGGTGLCFHGIPLALSLV